MNLNHLLLMFSENDKAQIEDRGLTIETLNDQIDRFKKGFQSITLESPAKIGNGILQLKKDELENYISVYERDQKVVEKFVPASGAASRMFKSLFEFLETNEENETITKFFAELPHFAFFNDLRAAFNRIHSSNLDIANHDQWPKIMDALLNIPGLGYGQLPKGLLKFHSYSDSTRTSVEEHIEEGLKYAASEGRVLLHFTVSPDHLDQFSDHVSKAIKLKNVAEKIEASYSTQRPSTDTIAVDMENSPFRTGENELLFRPAGHGAILSNLNELEADIIFIKNIDNVVPDHLKTETITYKKALAGVLITYQDKIFDLLKKSESGKDIMEEGNSLLEELGCRGSFSKHEIVDLLNRPIRVCGMVKNEGEPGGGPFWVKNSNGQSLQIVESAQVDGSNENQQEIFKSSTHFNPVDLICGVKNYRGEKFDLLNYRDEELGFITEKSFQGRKLKAMELPGLWNGSMANWNTIFVEVPLITFNPVKTVMDLLKETHR